jgi:hypothetical protein
MNETFQSLHDASRICAFSCSIPARIVAALRRPCLFWATKQSNNKKATRQVLMARRFFEAAVYLPVTGFL